MITTMKNIMKVSMSAPQIEIDRLDYNDDFDGHDHYDDHNVDDGLDDQDNDEEHYESFSQRTLEMDRLAVHDDQYDLHNLDDKDENDEN